MGRNNPSNFKVHANQQGGRRVYNDHDDRVGGQISYGNRTWRKDGSGSSGGGPKHVSFKSSGGGVRGRLGPPKKNRGGINLRNVGFDEDDDGDMSSQGSSRGGYQSGRARPAGRGMFKPRGGRGGRGRGGISGAQMALRRAVAPPTAGWHKVTITHGARYTREELLLAIKNATTHPFHPVAFQKSGPNMVFYLDSREAANAVRNLNEAVKLSDSFPLTLKVEPSAPPQAPTKLDDEMKEKLKLVLSSRFNVQNKALDLSKFHADPAFLGESAYLPLNRYNVMLEIIKIIGDNIPQLEAIQLSHNKLRTLDGFETLTTRAPSVKILYLSDNNISDHKELTKARGWKLLDMQIANNPMTARLKESNAYPKIVRKIFPSLTHLDGAELPKVVTFDDDDNATSAGLVPSVPKVTCNPAAEGVVLEFLKQYFNLYDGDNREQLMEAYHEDAVMSMSVAYPTNVSAHGSQSLQKYLYESRNLMRVRDDGNKRDRLLRQGRLKIASFLNDLPKTEHDMSSFTLDLTFATDRLMSFTVTGVFRERTLRELPLRHFNRMFVVVPQGSGFCIVNEMLHVTLPTAKQADAAFTTAQASSAPPAAAQLDANTKNLRIQEFSQKTGMNVKYCMECMGPNEYDLEKSFVAFQAAQQAGKIPIEAFEK